MAATVVGFTVTVVSDSFWPLLVGGAAGGGLYLIVRFVNRSASTSSR
jgi:hypothetical protein